MVSDGPDYGPLLATVAARPAPGFDTLGLWAAAGPECWSTRRRHRIAGRGGGHGLRQGLREWLDDGADKAAPGQTPLDVCWCCAPRLRWGLAWWQASDLAF